MRIEFLLENPDLLETSEIIKFIEDQIAVSSGKLYYLFNMKQDYLKPYSFYLSSFKVMESNEGKNLRFVFSSINKDICVIFYNNLLKNTFPSFSKIELKWAQVKPLLEIKGNIAIFKTLSPIILDIEDSQWYLTGNEKIIEEQINYFVEELSQYYLIKKLGFFEFKPVELYRVAIRRNKEVLQGFEGIFEIKAASSVLNLIFDVGVGYKKKLGFGMLDLFSLKRFDKYLNKNLVTLNE